MADRPLRRVLSSPRQCLQSSSAMEGVSSTSSPYHRRPLQGAMASQRCRCKGPSWRRLKEEAKQRRRWQFGAKEIPTPMVTIASIDALLKGCPSTQGEVLVLRRQ